MKKPYKMIIVCIAIIAVLIGGVTVYLARGKNGDRWKEVEFRYRGQDITMEEFYSFKGHWNVGRYLDSAVESTGVEVDTEEYKKSHEKWVEELREKYEGYSFEISEESLVYFGASCEGGYYYEDYADLQFVFHQPPTLEMVPPFLCASVRLKELDEEFDIILDGNGDAIFVAEYGFFELERQN